MRLIPACARLSCLAWLATIGTALATVSAMEIDPLPKDTIWLLQVDMREALRGSLGNTIRDVLNTPDTASKLKALTLVTGFNPLKDLERLTVSGTDFTPQGSVVLLSGQFDKERLSTLAEVAEQHQALAHGAETIHRWIDKNNDNKEVFAAIVGKHLIFGSALDAVRQQIDAVTLAKTTKPITTGPIAAAQTLTGPLVVAAAADRLADLPNLDRGAVFLKQITNLVAGIQSDEHDVILTVAANTNDETTATNLLQLAQGLIALTALGDHKDAAAAQLRPLIESAKLDRQGKTLNITAHYPLVLLRQAIAAQQQAKPAASPADVR